MAVKVIGLDKAVRELRKKGDQAELIIKKVMFDTASNIEFDAKNAAPPELGGEILGIRERLLSSPANNGFKFFVGIPEEKVQDFDAYAEFGTGQSAKQILFGPGYTDEMRRIAKRFYKNGLGTLRGKPFLIPAFLRYSANLVDNLKKAVEQAIK